jgi:hypothetical protein
MKTPPAWSSPRANLDGAQVVHGRRREVAGATDISEQPEGAMKRQEERNRAHVHVGQEGVFEVDLEPRGVGIPALDVGFPEQEDQGGEPEEHDDRLQENR